MSSEVSVNSPRNPWSQCWRRKGRLRWEGFAEHKVLSLESKSQGVIAVMLTVCDLSQPRTSIMWPSYHHSQQQQQQQRSWTASSSIHLVSTSSPPRTCQFDMPQSFSRQSLPHECRKFVSSAQLSSLLTLIVTCTWLLTHRQSVFKALKLTQKQLKLTDFWEKIIFCKP